MRLSPELETTLKVWEQRSAQVQKLSGEHQRIVYDDIGGIEKRGKGKFWFQAPDRGRLDLVPMKIAANAPASRENPKGGQYKVTADISAMWICNGQSVIQVEEEQKGYYRTEIPPQLRGENIMQSPLPFLFGMKAAEVKSRYKLAFGSHNSYDPRTNGKGQTVHIVAYPTRKADATNWSQADVFLDGTTFLPKQIRLKDPYGSQTTLYLFNTPKFVVNSRSWLQLRDPFSPNLSRYKLLGEQTVRQPPKVSQNAAPTR